MEDKLYEISLLYDFYGELLTGRQNTVLQYYYEDNYSLGEIAEELGISRQAVHDAVHKAEKSLYGYEEKLGLVERLRQTEADINKANSAIDKIIANHGDDLVLRQSLLDVKSILTQIEEE